MSDLRTELTKVMNEWDKPMNTNFETTTKAKGYAEKVFDFLRARGNSTLDDVKKAIPAGSTQSAASTLKTLLDRGLIARSEIPMPNYPGFGRKTIYTYFTVSDKYETVNKGYWKPKDKPVKAKRTEPVNVAPQENVFREKVKPELPPQPKQFNAEQFIETLTVTQAKAVYLALRGIFESRLHG
jgi:hypothetical protein